MHYRTFNPWHDVGIPAVTRNLITTVVCSEVETMKRFEKDGYGVLSSWPMLYVRITLGKMTMYRCLN